MTELTTEAERVMGKMNPVAKVGTQVSLKEKVAVDYRERFSGPHRWTPVLPEDELPLKKPKRIEVDDKAVLLYRDEERVYAIGAVCAHTGGPLEEGHVKDGCVTCPWHDSVFDLHDGGVMHGPATFPQALFATRIRDGQIELKLIRG